MDCNPEVIYFQGNLQLYVELREEQQKEKKTSSLDEGKTMRTTLEMLVSQGYRVHCGEITD